MLISSLFVISILLKLYILIHAFYRFIMFLYISHSSQAIQVLCIFLNKGNMEQPNSSLSTDALPMTPRPLEETEAISDPAEQSPQRSNDEEAVPGLSGTEDFEEIPAPHPDWKFNIFLDQIAEGITGEEFDQLKHLYRGKS